MKKNATAKALVMSVLALMLCLSMLVGTTFAWFTDSVKSDMNQIIAGNLNVELEYAADFNADGSVKTWNSAEGVSLFDENTLWEPGHTEVVYLRVKNAGTLALKYQFTVNVIRESLFENALGEKGCKLSNHLVFGHAVSDTAVTYESREYAQTAAGDTLGLGNYTQESVKLLPGAEEYVTLVVYMPDTIGNAANHKTGTAAPSIDLGVTLVATQTPYENDSFDDQYDKDLAYPDASAATLEELKQAIADAQTGDVIVLTDDIILDSQPLTLDKDLTIDGNGKVMTGDGSHRGFEIQSGATVVIKNVTITGINSGGSYSGVFHNYGTLTVENCILMGNQSEYSAAILEAAQNSVQVFRNCLIINNEAGRPGSGEGSVFQNYLSSSETTFEGCIIAGNTSHAGGTSGGAICFREYENTVTLVGCILANNDNADFSAYSEVTGISRSTVKIQKCVFGTVYNDQADILQNAADNGSIKLEGLSILNEDGTLKETGAADGVIPNVYCFLWSENYSECTMKILRASATGVVIEDHICTVTQSENQATAQVTIGGTTYTDTKETAEP